jgi:hypothetical protein
LLTSASIIRSIAPCAATSFLHGGNSGCWNCLENSTSGENPSSTAWISRLPSDSAPASSPNTVLRITSSEILVVTWCILASLPAFSPPRCALVTSFIASP